MPHKILRKTKEKEELSLDIKKLDLKDVYEFLKTNQRIDKKESISFVESLLLKINKEKITLSQVELELFSKSIKLLNLNSRPINVLTTLLLTLINRKNKY